MRNRIKKDPLNIMCDYLGLLLHLICFTCLIAAFVSAVKFIIYLIF